MLSKIMIVDFCPTDRRPRLSSYSWLSATFFSIASSSSWSSMLESIVHSGFVYFMAAQRAVRRTLIKEFYGSLLVLLEHFCLYDLVLDSFTKIISIFSGTHPKETYGTSIAALIGNIFLVVLLTLVITYDFKITSE